MSLGNVFTNPRDLAGGGNSDDAYDDCPGYLRKHVGESEESFKGKEKEEEESKEDCCGMMNILLPKCV